MVLKEVLAFNNLKNHRGVIMLLAHPFICSATKLNVAVFIYNV